MTINAQFFQSVEPIAYLGEGAIGGKAKGLEDIQSFLPLVRDSFPSFTVEIPRMIVLRTHLFDEFMEQNDLYDIALSTESDERIALAFQQASLPFSILKDLRLIVSQMRMPLVVRSSSLLEDAMHEPFAGIYGTKMTPNNQLDVDVRFRKLIEAIKFVYASCFFGHAKEYIRATRNRIEDEKMAVIIQEVIGKRFGTRFYPNVSGVAKSHNYYPISGQKPSDGVVNLALGLGKEIVDGGVSWSFCPNAPAKSVPFKSIDELLKNTQLKFWSVNVGQVPPYNPVSETEYLLHQHISTAEPDGTLKYIASTYDAGSDRIMDGVYGRGARIITFASILKHGIIDLAGLTRKWMDVCEEAYQTPVEIEFAIEFSEDSSGGKSRFGFLQVRPMNVSDEVVDLNPSDLSKENFLIRSGYVLGNGIIENLYDIVLVKNHRFDDSTAWRIAGEVGEINRSLLDEGRKCILIGYGRWGTTDPWAGIPVNYSQVSSAKVILEAGLAGMESDLSQASHFFHNVSGFQVLYFSIPSGSVNEWIDWDFLSHQTTLHETETIRHIRSDKPFIVKVDGRSGTGVILKPETKH